MEEKSREEMMQSLLGDIKARDALSQAQANMTPQEIRHANQLKRAEKKSFSGEHLGPLERLKEKRNLKIQAARKSKHKRTARGQINLHGSPGKRPDVE